MREETTLRRGLALLLLFFGYSSLPGVVLGDEAAALKPAFLVIASGSKDKAKAEAAYKDYQTRGLPTHGEFPKLLESSKIRV